MKLTFSTGGDALHLEAETPEDKKFLGGVVRDYVEPPRVRNAEIRLDIRLDGQIGMTSECGGRFYTGGLIKPQDQVLAVELPRLIAQLRERTAPPFVIIQK